MRVAYNNLIDTLLVGNIVASTEAIYYPISNIQDQMLAKRYRTTGITAQTITFDFGAAVSIDTFAIIDHNISTAATITVSANSTNSFPGATTETITGNANMILKFFTAHNYRYWRVTINDPTNTDGYLEMGRVWLGAYTAISPSSLLGFDITKKRNDTVDHGRGRQKYASEGIGWRKFNFEFPPTNYAMVKKVEDMFDFVGLHSSFIFCNFDTNRDYQIVEPCYCSFSKELSFEHTKNMKFEYEFSFEEEF